MAIQHEFNYQTWTADTVLSLVRVPWDNLYNHTVRFSNRAALNSWIDSQETPTGRIDKVSYAPVGRPIRVNIPFNSVQKYNYVRASNPIRPGIGDEQRDWYYFILGATYIAPNTTELVVSLDYFQSYIYDFTITQAFVERGHIGVANANRFNNRGRDFLTVPEGLEIGAGYRQIEHRSQDIMGFTVTGPVAQFEYDVLVVSTLDLLAGPAEWGTVDAPKKPMAKGSSFEGLAHGASFYIWDDVQGFKAWVGAMSEYSWILQGIISITVIPKLSRYMPWFSYASFGEPKEASGYTPYPKKLNLLSNWRDTMRAHIPARYATVADKFLTFPYMMMELSTWTGTPAILKPEEWNNNDAAILERSTFTPPNQRVEFIPRGYNAPDGANVENWGGVPDHVVDAMAEPYQSAFRDAGDDGGDYLDVRAQVANFPTMAILNDNASLYLANNANNIAQSYSQNNWAQQKSLLGNRSNFAQASEAIQASGDLAAVARAADMAGWQIDVDQRNGAWGLNGIAGIGQGALGGAVAGPGGAAVGAGIAAAGAVVNGMSNTLANNTAAAHMTNRRKASLDSQSVTTRNAEFSRDMNKAVADAAAHGDWAQNRAAIMARVQDAQMVPPSLVGQMGGEMMNLVHASFEVSIRWKLLDNANLKRIGEFWLRYGYAVEQFVTNIPADLHVMSKFSYWKLSETMTNNAAVPEGARQVVKGIFEKGTTVYRQPEYIGTVDYADNTPIGGIAL